MAARIRMNGHTGVSCMYLNTGSSANAARFVSAALGTSTKGSGGQFVTSMRKIVVQPYFMGRMTTGVVRRLDVDNNGLVSPSSP